MRLSLHDSTFGRICMACMYAKRPYRLFDIPKDKGPEALFSSEPFCSKSGI